MPWNELKVTYFDEDYTEQHHSYMHPSGSAYVYKYLEKVWNEVFIDGDGENHHDDQVEGLQNET